MADSFWILCHRFHYGMGSVDLCRQPYREESKEKEMSQRRFVVSICLIVAVLIVLLIKTSVRG